MSVQTYGRAARLDNPRSHPILSLLSESCHPQVVTPLVITVDFSLNAGAG
ncbi:hypothetical protein [Halomonas cupida]